MSTNPRILGVAGGGLNDATWAANADVARIGKAGEQKTAALLNKYAAPEDGVTVLHDLRIPIPGFSANVDHVVVAGRTVHIVDAKVWKPARYWTFRGKTRRGLERFEPAEKQTMRMAHEALSRYLDDRNVAASFATPVVAVWPSSTRAAMKVSWLRIPGAQTMTGDQFSRYADKQFSGGRILGIGRSSRSADPNVVAALSALLVSPPRHRANVDGW